MEIDLKFDDRFLEALWSGEKTSTIRRSCKGDPGDTFFVEYGDLIMEFRIMLVSTIHTLTDHAAHFLYQKEGFYSSQDLKDYCKNRGYTENLWIHEFRLIRQRRISDGTVTTSAPALSNEEDDIQDMMDYCADKGYTDNLYVHERRILQKDEEEGERMKPCQRDLKCPFYKRTVDIKSKRTEIGLLKKEVCNYPIIRIHGLGEVHLQMDKEGLFSITSDLKSETGKDIDLITCPLLRTKEEREYAKLTDLSLPPWSVDAEWRRYGDSGWHADVYISGGTGLINHIKTNARIEEERFRTCVKALKYLYDRFTTLIALPETASWEHFFSTYGRKMDGDEYVIGHMCAEDFDTNVYEISDELLGGGEE